MSNDKNTSDNQSNSQPTTSKTSVEAAKMVVLGPLLYPLVKVAEKVIKDVTSSIKPPEPPTGGSNSSGGGRLPPPDSRLDSNENRTEGCN